jgi:hypothetical protein
VVVAFQWWLRSKLFLQQKPATETCLQQKPATHCGEADIALAAAL